MKTNSKVKHGDVKIYFQGGSGSGKSLLADLIRGALRERGLEFEPCCEDVAQCDQILDMRDQNWDDVLIVHDVPRTLVRGLGRERKAA
jgi:hypothetical protein